MEKYIVGTDQKKKIILYGVGALALGVAGYFGWQWWKGRKAQQEDRSEDTPSFEIPSPPKKSAFLPAATQRNDDFPLKKGSRGTRVKALQDLIIAKYGKAVLPKYGADGDFGSEMVTALKKLNIPEVIDESTYNVLVKTGTINAPQVADALYKAAIARNHKQVIFTLGGMKSKDDYSSVNEVFKNLRIGGVRKTLVNGLLDAFGDEKQKQEIRLQFTRMGLSYDGKTWSLSGLDGICIITQKPTVIWKNPREGYRVPAGMVLGREIARRGCYTIFENGGKCFLVENNSVKVI